MKLTIKQTIKILASLTSVIAIHFTYLTPALGQATNMEWFRRAAGNMEWFGRAAGRLVTGTWDINCPPVHYLVGLRFERYRRSKGDYDSYDYQLVCRHINTGRTINSKWSTTKHPRSKIHSRSYVGCPNAGYVQGINVARYRRARGDYDTYKYQLDCNTGRSRFTGLTRGKLQEVFSGSCQRRFMVALGVSRYRAGSDSDLYLYRIRCM